VCFIINFYIIYIFIFRCPIISQVRHQKYSIFFIFSYISCYKFYCLIDSIFYIGWFHIIIKTSNFLFSNGIFYFILIPYFFGGNILWRDDIRCLMLLRFACHISPLNSIPMFGSLIWQSVKMIFITSFYKSRSFSMSHAVCCVFYLVYLWSWMAFDTLKQLLIIFSYRVVINFLEYLSTPCFQQRYFVIGGMFLPFY
jgi:hypothetical protein